MSLREDIWEKLPDNVTDVKVSRGQVYGQSTLNVEIRYLDPAHRMWSLDMNFSQKNQMTAEHIAKVMTSYMRYEVT